jgi:hypothetical protein
MKFDISNIEIKPITFSYVVVWKRLLTNIPPLDSEFCKNLFNKPNETNFGFNQQGLTIAINNNNPIVQTGTNNIIINVPNLPPNLVLGYQKFSIYHTDIESLYTVYDKFINEIKTKYYKFYSTLQSNQVGINIEFELIFKSPVDLKEWVNDKFFSEKKDDFSEINFQQFKFQMFEENKAKFVIVTLSPRIGNINTLYCLINDHYTVSPSELIFESNQLKTYINRTISKVSEKIIPQIMSNK